MLRPARRWAPTAVAALAVLALTGTARPADPADSVTITSGPSGEVTSTSATFSFTGTGAVTDFRCSLDTRILTPCTSPATYNGLVLGPHTFTVAGFRGDTTVNVSASRDWTIVGSGGPPPPPPDQTPPPFEAVLVVGPEAVEPGAVAFVDGTGSTGSPKELQYDLDGNGSFETKCGEGGKAKVAFGAPGTYTVGVLALAASGLTSTAQAKLTVGGAAKPPAAVKALGPKTILVGGCVESDPVAAAVTLYSCPATVVVGVAEAAFPPGSPKGSCFTREVVGAPFAIERFVAPASATVMVNGIRIQPSQGSSMILSSTLGSLGVAPGTGRIAVSLTHPGVDLDSGYGPLTWNVTKAGAVGEVSLGGFDDTFLGLKLPELKSPIVLSADRKAHLTLRLKLPKPVERASGALQLTTDNTVGPVIEAFTLQIDEIPIGPLSLQNVKASYHQDGAVDTWDGSFKLRLPPIGPGPTVGSELQVRNGLLTKLAVEMKKENPGWGPIACCVFMTRLKGAYSGPDEKISSHYAISAETDLTAGPKILGWSLLKLSAAGRLHWHPDFGAMLEVDGEMFLVEKFSLAKASLQAKMGGGNSWVSFQASASWNMIVFSAKGSVSGTIGDPVGKNPGQWYLGGGVDLCVEFVDLCAGGKVAASTKGVSGCLYLDLGYAGGIAAGGVYYWNGSWSTFWGCSKGKIKGKVGALELASTTAENAAPSITIPPGRRSYLVKISGVGGAPLVALVGPTGRRIATPAPGRPKTDRKTWLAVAVPDEKTTYVDIGRPEPGEWRIELLPGSVPIRGIGVAEPLPARLVTASVAGSGEHRVLRYKVVPGDQQQIVFTEVAADVRRTLATTTRTSGELVFSPADGRPGMRTVEATILRDGIVIRTEQVARFQVSSVGLPAPRVTLSRRGSGVSVRWLPVPDATSYVVRATVSDGRLLELRPKGRSTSASIPSVPGNGGVVVAVAAVSSGDRVGRSGTARLAPPATVAIPRRLDARKVRSVGFSIGCALPADGPCSATATLNGRLVASGKASGRYGQFVNVRLRLTAGGKAALRAGGTLLLTVNVPGQGSRKGSVRVG